MRGWPEHKQGRFCVRMFRVKPSGEHADATHSANLSDWGLTGASAFASYVNVIYIDMGRYHGHRGKAGRHRQTGLDRRNGARLYPVLADRPGDLGLSDMERTHGMRKAGRPRPLVWRRARRRR